MVQQTFCFVCVIKGPSEPRCPACFCVWLLVIFGILSFNVNRLALSVFRQVHHTGHGRGGEIGNRCAVIFVGHDRDAVRKPLQAFGDGLDNNS